MKTEEEIRQQIKDSKYSPSNDPLMARSIRKYNPNNSTYTNAGSGKNFAMIFLIGRVHTTDNRSSQMGRFNFQFKSPLNDAT